jgi:hypothetical protein
MENERLVPLETAIREIFEEEDRLAVSALRAETALCYSPVELYRQVSSGWNAAFQKPGHRDSCDHCRRATRIGFGGAAPGLRTLLWDRKNEALPEWWKLGIQDYIDATPWLRRIDQLPKLDFGLRTPLAAMRGGASKSDQPRWLGNALDEETMLESQLYAIEDSEHNATAFLLKVVDNDGQFPGKRVRVTLVGEETSLTKELTLDYDARGGIEAACEIPVAELRGVTANDNDRRNVVLGSPQLAEEL